MSESNPHRARRRVELRYRPLAGVKGHAVKLSATPFTYTNMHWAIKVGPYLYEVRKEGDLGLRVIHESSKDCWSPADRDWGNLCETSLTDEEIYRMGMSARSL